MLQWIEEHPYLTGGVALGIVVLFALFRNVISGNSTTAAATTTGTTGPDDSIQALQIQSAAALQNSQIAANAQVQSYSAAISTAQLNANSTDLQTTTAAQVQLAQTHAALILGEQQNQLTANQSNQTTQANLTLGLADNGQATHSILQLLAAQPNANAQQFQTLLVGGTDPTVSSPTTSTQPVNVGSYTIPSGTITSGELPAGTSGNAVLQDPVQAASPVLSYAALNPSYSSLAQNGMIPDPTSFVPTATMPFDPSVDQPFNSDADAIAASEAGWPSTAAPTYVQTAQPGGTPYNVLNCPSGYELVNGQCLGADFSAGTDADLLSQQLSAPWTPVNNLPDGSCPPGYTIVNGACYLAATHGG